MNHSKAFFLIFFLFSCTNSTSFSTSTSHTAETSSEIEPIKITDEKSWGYFLQHLKEIKAPVVDYLGNLVSDQDKHISILPYDVGKADLQQCADALMRLRAEYLFGQERYHEIGFHFTSGHFYSWNDYCNGLYPVPKGNSIKFINGNKKQKNHMSLRKYLDIVYTYASTISLEKELKSADQFDIGTVVIYPGSPGHCFIITDKGVSKSGAIFYKLAEGYTPAQSIYILKNFENNSPWHSLSKGIITTASYQFKKYSLKKFE